MLEIKNLHVAYGGIRALKVFRSLCKKVRSSQLSELMAREIGLAEYYFWIFEASKGDNPV